MRFAAYFVFALVLAIVLVLAIAPALLRFDQVPEEAKVADRYFK